MLSHQRIQIDQPGLTSAALAYSHSASFPASNMFFQLSLSATGCRKQAMAPERALVENETHERLAGELKLVDWLTPDEKRLKTKWRLPPFISNKTAR